MTTDQRTWWRIRVTWKDGNEFEYDTWTDPSGVDITTILERIRGSFDGPDVEKVEALENP